ncbi:MAG: ABC transporter substrate-binding (seleno)protein SaoB [Oscillospiraceae bacterium]
MGRRSLGQRLVTVGGCLVLALLAATYLLPQEAAKAPAALRLGAGDDITGVLLAEITRCAAADDRQDLLIGSYLFVDCCAGTAQWALQSEEIDLGFYCSQAALHMVNGGDAFELYGPVVMNGEVLAVMDGAGSPVRAGLPRKRTFLKPFAQTAYPTIETWQEVNSAYSLYALEEGEVDGVLLDVSAAHRAGAGVTFLPASKTPYVSYCLVVRKGLAETAEFAQFLTYYEQAIASLNRPERLIALAGMDSGFWADSGTEFLHLA